MAKKPGLARHPRDARIKRGLSVTEVAERAGVSTSSVYMWETGSVRPGDAKEKPVTVRLGRGPNDVVTIYPPPPDSLTPERRLAIRRAVQKTIGAEEARRLPLDRSP